MKPTLLFSLFVSLGAVGCSHELDDMDDEPAGVESASTVTPPSCSPGRAEGAVNAYQKALHDTIAFALGTAGTANDGYSVYQTKEEFKRGACRGHPNDKYRRSAPTTITTQAGRYLFSHRTWSDAVREVKLDTFEPDSQEKAAEWLITYVFRVTVPPDRPMTRDEFSEALDKLSTSREWSELPKGNYEGPTRGHFEGPAKGYYDDTPTPTKSAEELRAHYCQKAGCQR
jgi:muramidase (phage lysozyme)